jgi:hemerythrin-like domain-containing protein
MPQANDPNDPFDHLRREHAALGRAYRLLERLLDAAEAGTTVPRPALATVVEYITLFGDLRHHDKEESLLVPVLIQHGFDWYDGPLARLRRDHRQERYLVRVLSDLSNLTAAWSREDTRCLLGVGREFISFIQAHMNLEHAEIFAPARARLPPEVQTFLLTEFERFDAQHAASTDYVAACRRLDALLALEIRPVAPVREERADL